MSGHSKWSQIKRQKGATDVKRGQLFTKLGREITVAARQGGPDMETNFRLRLAAQRAREANMPAENVKRAIDRATGTGEGAALEEILYEGYGPAGAAILIEALTDNRNRTVSEIRNVFTRAGGNLGESGSVAWIFEAKGVLTIEPEQRDPEEIGLMAIDAGAEDVDISEEHIDAYTQPADLERVRKALEDAGLKIGEAELVMQPKTTVFLAEKEAAQAIRLIEKLEELDDVQKVYFNADFEAEVAEQAAS
jgi:YebC/PmpR family DNA-binding regulatory protein